jgi:hypothetical protein
MRYGKAFIDLIKIKVAFDTIPVLKERYVGIWRLNMPSPSSINKTDLSMIWTLPNMSPVQIWTFAHVPPRRAALWLARPSI